MKQYTCALFKVSKYASRCNYRLMYSVPGRHSFKQKVDLPGWWNFLCRDRLPISTPRWSDSLHDGNSFGDVCSFDEVFLMKNFKKNSSTIFSGHTDKIFPIVVAPEILKAICFLPCTSRESPQWHLLHEFEIFNFRENLVEMFFFCVSKQ